MWPGIRKSIPTQYKFLTVSVIFFLPVVYIAWKLELEYDEALSYMGILNSGWQDILLYSKFKLANSHVLNSLYFHLLQILNVKGALMYRLPGLLSYVLYCIYIRKLLKLEGYECRDTGFVIMYLLPCIVYFSLARGYALSYALFIVMLYHYKSYERTKASRSLLFFVLAGGISSISIFSFFFPFIAMLGLLAATNMRRVLKPVNLLILLITVPVAAYVFVMGQVVSRYDPDIIGNNALFKNGALSSLISYMSLSSLVPDGFFFSFKILICVTMIPAGIAIVRRRVFYTEYKIGLATICLMLLSHLLFSSAYPLVRGLMYLLPLMYLPMIYTGLWKHKLVLPHLLVIAFIGFFIIGLYVRNSLRPTGVDVLTYVSANNRPIVTEDLNQNLDVYARMYFDDTIKINRHRIEDMAVFCKVLDTAVYVVCDAQAMKSTGKLERFSAQYVLPHKTFYIKK